MPWGYKDQLAKQRILFGEDAIELDVKARDYWIANDGNKQYGQGGDHPVYCRWIQGASTSALYGSDGARS